MYSYLLLWSPGSTPERGGLCPGEPPAHTMPVEDFPESGWPPGVYLVLFSSFTDTS